jgi:MFS family permease
MLLVGLGFGGYWVLQSLVIADYFGRRHMAGVRGLFSPFQTVAGQGGPLLLGLMYGGLNGYRWVFALAVASWLVSVVAIYFTRPRAVVAPPEATEPAKAPARA